MERLKMKIISSVELTKGYQHWKIFLMPTNNCAMSMREGFGSWARRQ